MASHAATAIEQPLTTEATLPVHLQSFLRSVVLPVSAERAFEWHAAPGALERLTPPWEEIRVISRTGGIDNAGEVVLSVPAAGMRQTWVARHSHCVWGQEFRDIQVRGPFAHFEHRHRFANLGVNESQLTDEISYRLPGGSLGAWLGGSFVEQKLATMFGYRHRTTLMDLTQWKQLHESGFSSRKVLVSGATGLVASTLIPMLTTQGHRVARLLRKPTPQVYATGLPDVIWNSESGKVQEGSLDGVEAVVHLAGENIAGGRWTPAFKERIRDSRVVGTRKLCERLAALKEPPAVLVCASAIGFYGDRGDEVLTEESAAGQGFLPEVSEAWEEACEPARKAGIRVVNLRIGIVLTPRGGALQKLLKPFWWGAGGVAGNGSQYWSWISVDDLCGAILHSIATPSLTGPVNATAPQAVTNREFTQVLARVMRRLACVPLPEFAARMALGEMAHDLLFVSSRVQPVRLLSTGYQFRFTDLECCLRHLLGRPLADVKLPH